MKRIVICGCATHHRIAPERLTELAGRLAGHGEIEKLSDLCGLAALEPARLRDLAEADAVVACFPRAVRALFRFAGADIAAGKLFDLRSHEAEAIAAAVGASLEAHQEAPPARDESAGPATEAATAAWPAWDRSWTPWYPVIDADRCVHCGKCADFCLFGVYEGEAQVRVSRPEGCKTNCPACARICPQSAIIFPKYEKSPINGGLALEESLPVDPASIRKGSTYELLAARRRAARPPPQEPS